MTYRKLITPAFERFDDEEYKAYQVTEADFQDACANASYFAKKRILKKMQKVVYRKASFDAKLGLVRKDLPPDNVEEAVKSFVFCNKDKA